MKEILELDWDPDKFVKNVGDGIGALKEFEGQFEKVANQAKDVSFAKPISEITKLKSLIENSAKLEGLDLSKFNTSADEMVRSGPSITKFLNELKKNIKESTDPTEFEALKQIIGQTEGALKELTGEVGKNETKTKSAKARLREMKQELLALEDAGLDSTKMFKKLTLESAQLEDQIGDLSERVKVYASDTFKMDATVDVLQNVAGGWQLAEGAMALFGAEGEEVQKSMQKLLAIQNVANGLQQINAFLTGQSAGKLAILDGWNKLVAMSTSLVASSTATATASQRAYGVALASTGIGLLVISLGLLVANWDKVSRALSGTTKEQETLNKINAAAQENSAKDISRLTILTTVAQSNAQSTEKRRAAVQELQKEYPKYFASLSEEEILYGDITKSINAARLSIIEKAKAQAIEEELVAVLKEQFKILREYDEYNKNQRGKFSLDLVIAAVQKLRNKLTEDDLKDRAIQAKKSFDFLISNIKRNEDIEINGAKETTSKSNKVRKDAVIKGSNEIKDVQDAAYKKAIQGAISYYDDLENVVESKDKELNELRVSNIQNSIEKDIKSLELSYEVQNKALDRAIAENKQKLLDYATINPEQLEKIEAEIVKFEDRAKLIRLEYEIDFQNKKLEINKKALNEIYSQIQASGQLNQSKLDKNLSAEVLSLTVKYNNNLINKEAYEKKLAEIEARYQKAKKNERLKAIESEIEAVESQLNLDPDNRGLEEKLNQLVEEANKIKTEALKKNEVNAGDSIFGEIFGLDPTDKDFSKKKQQIVDGFRSLVNSTISIIKEQSRAEVEAYDVAIALQKQRVDEAQKLAEAGNAEYLQMERERLLELEQKREESARRQLEIDAALQTSQILVAIAGAAAQIAQGGVGNVIAGIATIGAAVASGFVLLNQLSASRPKFYHGTEGLGVKDNAKPTFSTGQDDYLIQAHRNERIVPDYINSKLGNIKNSELPDIVQKAKLYEASLVSQSMQTQTYSVPKIEKENNDLRKEIQELKKESEKQTKILEKFGVVIKLDEDGLAVSMQKSIEAKEKMKRA